jgi:excisionase family DNA binding protein
MQAQTGKDQRMKDEKVGVTETLLVGKRESANVLGVSVRTVDYLIEQGQLKVRRIGRRVLLHYEDLRQFAAKKD